MCRPPRPLSAARAALRGRPSGSLGQVVAGESGRHSVLQLGRWKFGRDTHATRFAGQCAPPARRRLRAACPACVPSACRLRIAMCVRPMMRCPSRVALRVLRRAALASRVPLAMGGFSRGRQRGPKTGATENGAHHALRAHNLACACACLFAQSAPARWLVNYPKQAATLVASVARGPQRVVVRQRAWRGAGARSRHTRRYRWPKTMTATSETKAVEATATTTASTTRTRIRTTMTAMLLRGANIQKRHNCLMTEETEETETQKKQPIQKRQPHRNSQESQKKHHTHNDQNT